MGIRTIDDSYIDDYNFGGGTGEDILLLIIASVTPIIDQGEEMPKDNEGRAIYASTDNCSLTEAGVQYAGKQIGELTHALGRPFNDDDCSYGYEYAASDDIETPLRFIYPAEKMGCTCARDVQWMAWGTDQCDNEVQDAVIFFDLTSGDYKTAFLVSIERGNDPSSYLLYWNHVKPYLSPLTSVSIAAYNDMTKCVTMQDYYCGEIDDKHDARYADRWIDSLVLTKKEISAIRQQSLMEDGDNLGLSEISPDQDMASEMKPKLVGKALLDLINSGRYTDKGELARACGYSCVLADGRQVVNYTAFLEAMKETEFS